MRTRWAAVGAACAVVLGAGGLVGVSASTMPGSSLTPIEPIRILDTRSSQRVGSLDVAGESDPLRLKVAGAPGSGIPDAGVRAVLLNVTVVEAQTNQFGGYLSVYPCASVNSTRPDVSNINFVSGQTIANSVTVPLSDDGHACFYVYGTAHLLADASGYYSEITVGTGTADAYSSTEVDELLAAKADSSALEGLQRSVVSNEADIDAAQVELGQKAGTNDLSRVEQTLSDGLSANRDALELLTLSGAFTSSVVTPAGYPSVAILGDGRPLVSYHRPLAGSPKSAVVCGDTMCGSGVGVAKSLSSNGNYTASVTLSSGLGAIAHINGNLVVTVCQNLDCTSSVDRILDSNANTYVTAAINGQGNPVVAYLYSLGGHSELRVVACLDPSCGSSTMTQLDTRADGRVFWYPNIAVGPSGNPVITYWSQYASPDVRGELRIVACNDPICSGGDDLYRSLGLTSPMTSLAVGETGEPLIGYYLPDSVDGSQTGTEFALLQCGNWSCSSGNQSRTLINGLTAQSPQPVPAIVVRPSGNPLIAFYSESSDALYLVNCDDPSCADGNDTPFPFDGDVAAGASASLAIGPHGHPVMAYEGSGNVIKLAVLALE